MRCRGSIIEYNLNEAAKMLNMTPDNLRDFIEEGKLQYWYHDRRRGYKFHNASLENNLVKMQRKVA